MTTPLMASMASRWSVPLWAAVAAGIVLVALVVAVALALAGRARARRRAEESRAAGAELLERLEALERAVAANGGRPGGVVRTEREFVITSLGGPEQPAPVPALPAGAFADAVLRDTVVHAAALAHGVRRALSPEVRNRIRFEMRRELRRTRKERKTEVREALREYRAKHRADIPDGEVA
ncbi:hypothetical protein [Nocardioides sp. KR10-350]|uniref:hypothetical protein n=1 Tax=Nocardioides cheoyonin TaxID=3156615 RepID=UPI0032B3D051